MADDEINMVIIKYVTLELLHRILNFGNICWMTEYIPEQWSIVAVVI
jgi:hypothetical protein